MTVEPFDTVGGIGIDSVAVPPVSGGATSDVPLVESPPSVVNVNAVTPTLSVTWARNSAVSPAAMRVDPLAVVTAVTIGFTVSATCSTRPIEVVLPDVSVATIESVAVCGACNSPGRTTVKVCLEFFVPGATVWVPQPDSAGLQTIVTLASATSSAASATTSTLAPDSTSASLTGERTVSVGRIAS